MKKKMLAEWPSAKQKAKAEHDRMINVARAKVELATDAYYAALASGDTKAIVVTSEKLDEAIEAVYVAADAALDALTNRRVSE